MDKFLGVYDYVCMKCNTFFMKKDVEVDGCGDCGCWTKYVCPKCDPERYEDEYDCPLDDRNLLEYNDDDPCPFAEATELTCNLCKKTSVRYIENVFKEDRDYYPWGRIKRRDGTYINICTECMDRLGGE